MSFPYFILGSVFFTASMALVIAVLMSGSVIYDDLRELSQRVAAIGALFVVAAIVAVLWFATWLCWKGVM